MLRTNRLKLRLGAGLPVYGLLSCIPTPLMVEMIGYAGYDFVIIDMEHVGVDAQTLEDMIRAAEGCSLTPLVRLPGVDPKVIMRTLDAGAQGVVVPCIQSASQAREVVAASRYYPEGSRGISGGRTTGFGTLDLKDYMALANSEIMVALMIEDTAGVDNIEAIVATPGVDMILEGAIDLSQSLGVPAQPHHASVQSALRDVAAACAVHRIPFCAMPRKSGQHAAWSASGVTAFVLGDDRGLSFRSLQARLVDSKE